MRAYYDLSIKPATYDFVVFLVVAKTLGVTEIVFDVSKGFQKKKFPEDTARRMYENILQPACGLWGLPFSEGIEGDFTPGYRWNHLIDAWNERGLLAQPTCTKKAGARYTVTIRDSIRNKHRDSNRNAWERFAAEIGAEIIEDAYINPIPLEERFALYNGAEMNFFKSNGPAALPMCSQMPFTIFSPPCADEMWPQPMSRGRQLPWANNNQRIVWADDTYENIRATHG